jgi:hypothetical protein
VIEGGSTMTMEQAVQRLLDDALGAGVITLYTPVSPSYTVTRFGYQREPVLDAIQRLVQSIGWDCRYLWDSGTSSFRLTLYNPPRAKTTPDLTIGPSQYREHQAAQDLARHRPEPGEDLLHRRTISRPTSSSKTSRARHGSA